MKKLGICVIFGALALSLLFTIPCYSFPPDTTKPDLRNDSVPGHGPMPDFLPKTPLPDSLRFPPEPFDSTLLTATFIIETTHKLYPDFKQVDTLKFGQIFALGDDDEYQAKITHFNPHLSITSQGQYLRESDTLYNPAVRIQVMKGDSVVQRSWGFFYAGAPHYRASDYFGFKLVQFHVNEKKYIKPPDKR